MKAIPLILLILLVSCSPEEQEKMPDYVIPPEKMGLLMAEVQFLHSVHEDRFIKLHHLQEFSQVQYRHVLDSLSVTPGAFDSSMRWYSLHQEELEQVYDQALSILTERLSSLETKKPGPSEKEKEDKLSRPTSVNIFGKELPVDENGNIIPSEIKKAQGTK